MIIDRILNRWMPTYVADQDGLTMDGERDEMGQSVDDRIDSAQLLPLPRFARTSPYFSGHEETFWE
jgi:hypothetical protein